MVRSTQPPLSQLLICQAFPAVAQCTLHTDDNATMQVPAQGAEGAAPRHGLRPQAPVTVQRRDAGTPTRGGCQHPARAAMRAPGRSFC